MMLATRHAENTAEYVQTKNQRVRTSSLFRSINRRHLVTCPHYHQLRVQLDAPNKPAVICWESERDSELF